MWPNPKDFIFCEVKGLFNDIQVINTVNLFHIPRGKWNPNKKRKFRKMGSWLFSMYFSLLFWNICELLTYKKEHQDKKINVTIWWQKHLFHQLLEMEATDFRQKHCCTELTTSRKHYFIIFNTFMTDVPII